MQRGVGHNSRGKRCYGLLIRVKQLTVMKLVDVRMAEDGSTTPSVYICPLFAPTDIDKVPDLTKALEWSPPPLVTGGFAATDMNWVGTPS